jgi:hypothetical protein
VLVIGGGDGFERPPTKGRSTDRLGIGVRACTTLLSADALTVGREEGDRSGTVLVMRCEDRWQRSEFPPTEGCPTDGLSVGTGKHSLLLSADALTVGGAK